MAWKPGAFEDELQPFPTGATVQIGAVSLDPKNGRDTLIVDITLNRS